MKAILTAILVILSVQVQAQELSCDYYADQAREIMTKMQNMTPMRQVEKEHVTNKILGRIVDNAYASMRFHTQQNKTDAAIRYEDLVYLRCKKGRANK